jgi:hypothetical protein
VGVIAIKKYHVFGFKWHRNVQWRRWPCKIDWCKVDRDILKVQLAFIIAIYA